MELLISLTTSSKCIIKLTTLKILRNIAFNSMNRPRLLSSGMYLICVNSLPNSILQDIIYSFHKLRTMDIVFK